MDVVIWGRYLIERDLNVTSMFEKYSASPISKHMVGLYILWKIPFFHVM